MKLIFIRHGATKSNEEHRYLGKRDESLSEKGIALLYKAKKDLYYPEADCVFCGPMRRCIETAKIIYPDKEINIIPEWTEIDFGEFENKNYIELKDDPRYQRWLDSNGRMAFPSGENMEDFKSRCQAGLHNMIRRLNSFADKKAEKYIAIIVHGGTVMALLSQYAGGDFFDYQLHNGAGYKCTLETDADAIRLVNIENV